MNYFREYRRYLNKLYLDHENYTRYKVLFIQGDALGVRKLETGTMFYFKASDFGDFVREQNWKEPGEYYERKKDSQKK